MKFLKTSTPAPSINGAEKLGIIYATENVSVSVWKNVHGWVQVEIYDNESGERAVLTAKDDAPVSA